MQADTKKIINIMIAMGLAIMMMNIEVTSIYIILHPLGLNLHLHSSQLPWIVTMYLLFFAAMIVIGGRLGDLYGHRNVLVLGLILFAVFSLIGGMTSSFDWLLLARAGQGLGAALMWPCTTAIAFSAFPSKHKGLGIGIISGVVGLPWHHRQL